jgi:hypothetical protein
VTLNTDLPFVLILPSYFTYKCQVALLLDFGRFCQDLGLGYKKNIWYIILIAVDHILLTIKQLKQVTPCFINSLCLSLLCIKYVLSGHSDAQEIKHLWKFYWTSHPQFWEKPQPVYVAQIAVLFRLAIFLLEALSVCRHVAPLWHIILIPSQPVVALSP